jgi:hypothetical protein
MKSAKSAWHGKRICHGFSQLSLITFLFIKMFSWNKKVDQFIVLATWFDKFKILAISKSSLNISLLNMNIYD